MKAMLKLALASIAFGAAMGVAQAQEAPNPAPPNAGLMGENSTVRNGGDTSDRDSAMARDAAIAKARSGNEGKKTVRTVPATAADVVAGSEVRDSKGQRVGSIASVSMGAAVLSADGGAVEVPLEAFGKDGKGLLIGMTKADFDKLVADANKPK